MKRKRKQAGKASGGQKSRIFLADEEADRLAKEHPELLDENRFRKAIEFGDKTHVIVPPSGFTQKSG